MIRNCEALKRYTEVCWVWQQKQDSKQGMKHKCMYITYTNVKIYK